MRMIFTRPAQTLIVTGLFGTLNAGLCATGTGSTPTEKPVSLADGLPAAPSTSPAEDPPVSNEVKLTWKNGLSFESADKRFKAKLGGRLFFDAAFISADDDYDAIAGAQQEDGAEVRQARWYLSGELDENIEFKWQYDFAGGVNNRFKDVYLGVKDIGIGGLRAGQFKEPFHLEELGSANYITFMERSLADALAPKRNIGVMLYDHNATETLTWAAGVFRDDGTDTGVDTGDGEYSLTARITGLPMHQDDEHLLHLGAAFSHRAIRNQALTVSSRPENNLATNIATGTLITDSVDAFGLEAAWIGGPFSVQAELIQAMLEASSGGTDADLTGYYIFVSWFLTGESRAYKPTSAVFERVKVKEPWGKAGGRGAWEFAARYSSLDLNDGTFSNDEVSDITLGANWYLTQNARLMFNYIHSEAEDAANDGSADILATRFAVEF